MVAGVTVSSPTDYLCSGCIAYSYNSAILHQGKAYKGDLRWVLDDVVVLGDAKSLEVVLELVSELALGGEGSLALSEQGFGEEVAPVNLGKHY